MYGHVQGGPILLQGPVLPDVKDSLPELEGTRGWTGTISDKNNIKDLKNLDSSQPRSVLFSKKGMGFSKHKSLRSTVWEKETPFVTPSPDRGSSHYLFPSKKKLYVIKLYNYPMYTIKHFSL